MAKVMISISDDLLARLDEEAARRAMTRSGLLQRAVRRELQRFDPVSVRAAVAEARAAMDGAPAADAAALVRADRDAH